MIVWRDQAEHAAHSLAKGSRVVVVVRLQQRSWTAEDGGVRSVVEVVADELGPSLRWTTLPRPGRRRKAQANSRYDICIEYPHVSWPYCHAGYDSQSYTAILTVMSEASFQLRIRIRSTWLSR